MAKKLKITKRKRSSFEKLARILLERIPLVVTLTELAPGRKIICQIPTTSRASKMGDYLVLWAESTLPPEPKDKDVGYELHEVVNTFGIHMFSKTKGGFPAGQSYEFNDLLTVIEDVSLKNRLIYKINEMKRIVSLDDNFLINAVHEPVTFN